MNTRFLPYDWFKLIVLLLLIALLILLPRCIPDTNTIVAQQAAQPVDSAESTLTTDAAPQALATTTETAESVTSTEAAPQEVTSDVMECTNALPTRLSGVGARAEVVNAFIPLRDSPEVGRSNILKGMPEGTVVEIISLPVCTPYLTGANHWWGVRTADGRIGYAAEGSAINPIYYLQEIP